MHRIIVGVASATLFFCTFALAGGQDQNGDKDSSHPAFKVLNGSRANPNITLTQLLDSYEKAVGGKEAIEKIRTASVYAERRAQTKPGPERFGTSIEYFNFKLPNEVLPIRSGSKDVPGYDGQTFWYNDPNKGIQRKPQVMNVFAAQEFDLFSLLRLRTAFPQMELVGSSKVEGRDVYAVDAPLGSQGLYRRLFIDAETRLLISSIVIQLAAGQTLISELFYSDFREVSGVKFPFAVRAIDHNSQSSLEIRVSHIECNIPLGDAISSQ